MLAVLYAYNDLQDAPDDVRNPKKNQQLVRTLHEGRRRLFPWLYGWMLGLVAVAGLLVDAQTALLAAALFAVNALYSHLLKGQPILDLLVVGAWGGLYAALAAPPWRIALAVGLMTSVMHVFPTLVDRDVDAANHVRTTAVVSRYGATAALVLAGAALFVALLPLLGPALALSAFLPLALRLLVRRTGAAWMLSRLYCAVTLIAALRVLHGSS